MKTNLFDFARNDLIHETVLSWILSWGNNKESSLYNLSKDFIKLLTGKNLIPKTVDIELGEDKINISVLVNKETHILISDRLNIKEEGRQLDINKKTIGKNYLNTESYYAYVAPETEPIYDSILDRNFRVIERKDLLSLIKEYKDKNDILKDYYNYLYKIEIDYNSSDNQNLDKWTYRGWEKFFINLNKRFKDGKWSWIDEEDSRFFAFYWGYNNYKYEDKVPYTIYTQVEDRGKITFKLIVENKKYRSEVRDFLWNTLEDLDISKRIKKPRRFANGRTMTFAEVSDYTSKHELYMFINLVEKAKRYLDFELSDFCSKNNEYFNIYEEPASFLEHIYVINGSIPKESLYDKLVLVTNIERKDLKKLMNLCKGSDIYVFSDENSLEEFKNCLKSSEGFLEAGYNMVYLNPIKSEHSIIKLLSYFYGSKNLNKNKKQLVFLNYTEEDFKKTENQPFDNLFYIFRDYISSRDIDGFNIEEIKL